MKPPTVSEERVAQLRAELEPFGAVDVCREGYLGSGPYLFKIKITCGFSGTLGDVCRVLTIVLARLPEFSRVQSYRVDKGLYDLVLFKPPAP